MAKLKTTFFKPAVISISVVIVLLIVLGFWLYNVYFSKNNQTQDIPLTAQQIQTYIEGDSLLIHTLNDYKQEWNSQQENYIHRKGKGFFGGEEEVDSSGWKKEWQPVLKNIELAIFKRNLINEKKFAELKTHYFSINQQSFKDAIDKIDSTKYNELKQKLGDVSSLTLSDIAAKVDKFPKSNNPERQSKAEIITKTGIAPKPNDNQVKFPGKSKESNIKSYESKKESNSNDKTAEIMEYLKGAELDKSKLEEYKTLTGINKNLKNSIQLGLEFWLLNGTGEGNAAKTYYSYREKVKLDENFEDSKLRKFIEKMCQEGADR